MFIRRTQAGQSEVDAHPLQIAQFDRKKITIERDRKNGIASLVVAGQFLTEQVAERF